jgi:hypothetical protein
MKLTALRAHNPVQMMAAYGALRLLPGARLRWADAHPELDWDGDIVKELAARLPERRQAPEVTQLDDPRDSNIGGRAGFRALAKTIPGEWLLAYASEGPDGVLDSDLLLMGGRHRFVANARDIMDTLMGDGRERKLTEALRGPWPYADRGLQAWGWDAAARIDAASSPKDVSGTPKFGVAAAYWLAWESLPFWPMINRRTVGMRRDAWVYPTCREWLDADGLRALILGAGRMKERERVSLGVTRWSSAILKPSDYGKVLGWAHPLAARTGSSARNPGRFAPT